jgi:hypothetical protein
LNLDVTKVPDFKSNKSLCLKEVNGYTITAWQDFLIFTDYPTTDAKVSKGKPVSFNIKGDPALTCSLRIIPQSDNKLPDIKVSTGKRKKEELKGTKTPEGHLEFKLNGGTPVTVSWAKK